jgi:hypothetical protein
VSAVVRIPHQPPANDNGKPRWFPVFTELFDPYKYDLTRAEIHIYGALVALQRAGARPTVRDIGEYANVSVADEERYCRRVLSKLEAQGLIRRSVAGGQGVPSVYELLGPDIDAA